MTHDRAADGPLADDPHGRRIALTEINGRRVNEAIEQGHAGRDTAVFVCECGELGCATTLELALEEYDRVRTSFDRFIVVPGHEIPKAEEVVERGERFHVVAKVGEAAEMARADDPRAQER